MSHFRITSRYAKALLDLSIERNTTEEVEKDVELIVEIFENNRNMIVMLKNPIILPQKKQAILDKVLKVQVSEVTYKFMEVIVRKNRSNLLYEIMKMFNTKYKEYKHISDAIFYTATESTQESKDAVVKMLSEATGETINLESIVDEEILGGFMIRYHDRLLDASVASKLRDLRKELLD
jgi:F-type H+-transporting ATPase subunit delta